MPLTFPTLNPLVVREVSLCLLSTCLVTESFSHLNTMLTDQGLCHAFHSFPLFSSKSQMPTLFLFDNEILLYLVFPLSYLLSYPFRSHDHLVIPENSVYLVKGYNWLLCRILDPKDPQ